MGNTEIKEDYLLMSRLVNSIEDRGQYVLYKKPFAVKLTVFYLVLISSVAVFDYATGAVGAYGIPNSMHDTATLCLVYLLPLITVAHLFFSLHSENAKMEKEKRLLDKIIRDDVIGWEWKTQDGAVGEGVDVDKRSGKHVTLLYPNGYQETHYIDFLTRGTRVSS